MTAKEYIGQKFAKEPPIKQVTAEFASSHRNPFKGNEAAPRPNANIRQQGYSSTGYNQGGYRGRGGFNRGGYGGQSRGGYNQNQMNTGGYGGMNNFGNMGFNRGGGNMMGMNRGGFQGNRGRGGMMGNMGMMPNMGMGMGGMGMGMGMMGMDMSSMMGGMGFGGNVKMDLGERWYTHLTVGQGLISSIIISSNKGIRRAGQATRMAQRDHGPSRIGASWIKQKRFAYQCHANE